ncbi:MAG TPA: cyclic nucleotide-binding domain-containing protein [Terracidiphilus sp.]|nr:cyclic nucleotide-binding domain-containing protein [Terracidiphilus sp.]
MNLDSSAFVADPDLLAALGKRSTKVLCQEDRVLFRQGETSTCLYVLNSGNATLTMTSHRGETIIETVVSAGSLLGLPGFVGNHPYSMTARAHKGTEVGVVTREDFSQLMLAEPGISLRILSVLAAEVRSARAAISED